MFFSSKPSKAKLQGLKTVSISGSKFVIRKINPMIDFEPDRMPQIFTSFVSQRKEDPSAKFSETAFRKVQNDIKEIISVAVVEPKLVKKDEDGITVDDLFRNPDMGYKLFMEIMMHSMNYFSGFKSLFFCLRTRLSLFIHWRNNTDAVRRTWLLREGI